MVYFLCKVEKNFLSPHASRKGTHYVRRKKSRYTKAQAKASAKYLAEKVEDIRIRVPKGQKAVIKAHAEKLDESMNQFVTRAITETMERDNA